MVFSVLFYNVHGELVEGKHFASMNDLYNIGSSVVLGKLTLSLNGVQVKTWTVEDGLLEADEEPLPGVWNYFRTYK